MKKKSVASSYQMASVCILIGLLGLGGGFWRKSVASEVEAGALQKEVEATTFSQNVRNAQRLDVDLESLKSLNKQIAGRLSDSTDVAASQQYFYTLEANTGVKILDLRKGATLSAPARKSAAGYGTVSYTINVEGGFPQLWAFLRGIESGPKMAQIVSSAVSVPRNAVGDSEAVLSMTIELEMLSNS